MMIVLNEETKKKALEYAEKKITKVTIVNCGDCEYYHKNKRMPHGWCDWHDSEGMRPDDFCSRGKEKKIEDTH